MAEDKTPKRNEGADSGAVVQSRQSQENEVLKNPETEQSKPKHVPKINLIIAGLLMIVFVILDIVDIALKFVGSDDFLIVDAISYIFLVPYFFYYRYIKKADFSGHMVIMSLIELVPYIGTLPLRSFGLGITVYIDRNPDSKIAQGVKLAAQYIPSRLSKTKVGGAKIPARKGFEGNRSARVMNRADSMAGEKYSKAKSKIPKIIPYKKDEGEANNPTELSRIARRKRDENSSLAQNEMYPDAYREDAA